MLRPVRTTLVLLISLIASCAGAKSEVERQVASIDDTVKDSRDGDLPGRACDVTTATDYGGELVFYGTRSRPGRVAFRVGLSSCVVVEDMFFCDGKLVFVRRQCLNYPCTEDGTVIDAQIHDPEKLKNVAEEELYFCNDELISRSVSGEARVLSDGEPNGENELKFADFLLRHWDDSHIDLELWIRQGTLPD